MLTNELLEAKYRAQRALAEQSGDDLHTYVQNVHRIVQDVERKHGLKFRYRRGKITASVVRQANEVKRPWATDLPPPST